MLDDRLRDAARGHVVQTETLSDLGAGHYEAVTTVARAFDRAVLGLGVAEAADGEIVAVDGEVWRVPADGRPVPAPGELGLPFAVAARGGRGITVPLAAGATFAEVTAAVDAAVSGHAPTTGAAASVDVAAVRLDGTFRDVLLRSEPRQEPPYRLLSTVLDHEVRFSFAEWRGTLVGFRFPDVADGVTVPGLHLHGISTDRSSGGHCHHATAVDVLVTVWVDDVHIVVPPHGAPTGGRRTTL